MNWSSKATKSLFVPHHADHYDANACKRLLYAILERSLMDLVADQKHLKRVGNSSSRPDSASCNARYALQWIMDDQRHDISSYNRICAILGLDKTLMRNPKILTRVIDYYTKTANQMVRE